MDLVGVVYDFRGYLAWFTTNWLPLSQLHATKLRANSLMLWLKYITRSANTRRLLVYIIVLYLHARVAIRGYNWSIADALAPEVANASAVMELAV